MIVDIVFVVLVVVLLYAIYRIKFKNEEVKIAATQINEPNVPFTYANNLR